VKSLLYRLTFDPRGRRGRIRGGGGRGHSGGEGGSGGEGSVLLRLKGWSGESLGFATEGDTSGGGGADVWFGGVG